MEIAPYQIDPTVESMKILFSGDRTDRSLSYVISGGGTPTGFARHVAKTKLSSLYKKYSGPLQDQFPKLPDILKDAWSYEYLIRCATEVRLEAILGPEKYTTYMGPRFLSTTYRPSLWDAAVPASRFAGLIGFGNEMTALYSRATLLANTDRLGLTRRLISTIGSIDNPHWILHDPLWFKTLLNSPEHLRSFKGFLVVASINCAYADEMFFQQFDLPTTELMDHMETFIDLRESTITTRKDIITFIERVEHYALEDPGLNFGFAMNCAPFEKVREIHGVREAYFDKPPNDVEFSDNPIIQFLLTIKSELSLSSVNDQNVTPVMVANDILVKMTLDEVTHFLALVGRENWINTIHAEPTTTAEKAQVAYDNILLAVVGYRAMLLSEDKSERHALTFISKTAHLLLNIEDELGKTGVSAFSAFVNSIVRSDDFKVSDRNMETIMLMVWAWGLFNYDRSTKMTPRWKAHLENQIIAVNLRNALFTFIEWMIAKPEIVQNVNCTKTESDFFLWYENLCELLTTDPMYDEVDAHLSEAPAFFQYLSVGPEIHCIWSAAFNDFS